MQTQTGYIVQPSLMMEHSSMEHSSPRGRQQMRELLEEYDNLLAGRIDSLQGLSESEQLLRSHIEFDNAVYEKKLADVKAVREASQSPAVTTTTTSKKTKGSPQGGPLSDDDGDDDGATDKQFGDVSRQVKRMFRAVRLFERKKKLDRLSDIEKAHNVSFAGGNLTELLDRFETSSDVGSLTSSGHFSAAFTATSSEQIGVAGPQGQLVLPYEQWSDDEVRKHLIQKIEYERDQNVQLREKLRTQLTTFMDASAQRCISDARIPDVALGGISASDLGKLLSPTSRTSGPSPSSSPGAVNSDSLSAATAALAAALLQQDPTSSDSHLSRYSKVVQRIEGLVDHFVEYGTVVAGQAATHEQGSGLRTTRSMASAPPPPHAAAVCYNQILSERKKSQKLRQQLVEIDAELRRKRLDRSLQVPDRYLPTLLPPSQQVDEYVGNPKKKGSSFALSATVSDVVHCTTIVTELVNEQIAVSTLQRRCRLRKKLLDEIFALREAADRARATGMGFLLPAEVTQQQWS